MGGPGCKKVGGGKQNCQGETRVWRLDGLGPWLGYSLAISQNIFILQFNLANYFFKNGDDRLGKIFSDNFRKIK